MKQLIASVLLLVPLPVAAQSVEQRFDALMAQAEALHDEREADIEEARRLIQAIDEQLPEIEHAYRADQEHAEQWLEEWRAKNRADAEKFERWKVEEAARLEDALGAWDERNGYHP